MSRTDIACAFQRMRVRFAWVRSEYEEADNEATTRLGGELNQFWE